MSNQTKIRFLHLTDFHFQADKKSIAYQDALVLKMCSKLQELGAIDFLIFSGDLVFSGNDIEDFNRAYFSFIKRVAEVPNIGKTKIFFCAGNHDIARGAVSKITNDYLRKLNTNAAVNAFSEKKGTDDFLQSIKPSNNYNSFIKRFYEKFPKTSGDTIDELFSTHVRALPNDKTIGFVSINTAWLSSGDDRGNLIYPLADLQIAFQNISKCDIRVLLAHHPLEDLKEYNKLEIEDFVLANFHFQFSGHVHKRYDLAKINFDEGMFCTHAHAALTPKEQGKIGFTMLEADIETSDLKIDRFLYDDQERIFLNLPSILTSIPLNSHKAKQVKLIKVIRKHLADKIVNSNESFVYRKNFDDNTNYTDVFVDPILKTTSTFEFREGKAVDAKIPFTKLSNEHDNHIIYGKDKTGKTSILQIINIRALKSFVSDKILTFYVDLKKFWRDDSNFNFQTLLVKYLECNKSDLDDTLKTYHVKLLLDNFSPECKNIISQITSLVNKYPKVSFIATADLTLVRSQDKLDFDLPRFNSLFIHEVSRPEIRQLMSKWPAVKKEKIDQYLDRIVALFKQHSIPFNFWNLSIFLLIFSNKKTDTIQINSSLIELYIDDILDKSFLANNDAKNRFSYKNYKTFLAQLAHTLLTKHRESSYTLTFLELTQFTEDFINSNKRRVGDPLEIIHYVLERGIIFQTDENKYTFRMNGVFEYFLAHYMVENHDFRDEIIADQNIYLAFKNELELYSGFQRTDKENEEYLKQIYSVTQSAFSDLNSKYGNKNVLDSELQGKVTNNAFLEDQTQQIAKFVETTQAVSLTDDEKDVFFDDISPIRGDESEVKIKKPYDTSIKNFEILERFLSINGRVFKNIDNITNSELVDEVFDFIFISACNLGFQLIDEFEQYAKADEENKANPDFLRRLLNMIATHIPTVVQQFLSDNIGHVNMEKLILEKIHRAEADPKQNQYALFIYYFLLIDLDPKKNKKYIDKVIGLAKSKLISASILIKLFLYLLFKAYDDDQFILYLKNEIRTCLLKINPHADMGVFDRNFENTQKILLMKRDAEKKK